MRSPQSDERQVDSADRLLRLPEVLKLFPLSRSSWYRGAAEGRFPRGIRISLRAVAWRKSDIDALIQNIEPK